MIWGDAVSILEMFKLYFKVHSLVSVQTESIILGQRTNLNVIFHVVGSVYRFVVSNNRHYLYLTPVRDLGQVC